MAESVVSFVCNRLDFLLHQKYSQLAGIRREVESIKHELATLWGILEGAEAQQDAGELHPVVQEWVKQLRDMAYETEDVVDEYLLRCGPNRAPGFLVHVREIYTSLANLRAHHQISSQIRDINYRIKRISTRDQRYAILAGRFKGHGSREILQNPIRNHDLLIEETKLVGIELPKRQIISHILDRTSHLKVVSVMGMGGLGKTTLVGQVYEAAEVKSAFSCHAWLTISQSYQIEDVFRQLMRDLEIPRPEESLGYTELTARVKDFLKGKRYIIVLDDVWGMHAWEFIKRALPDDANCCSRVILTTSKLDVATVCCRDFGGHLHEMKPLSPEESWTLFCRKIFREDTCPPNLEDISRSILRKCEGLPLGIVAIADLLLTRDTSRIDEWEMVRGSLGGELEGSGKLGRVRRILLRSYNDLPSRLKSCLLCMGMYPKNWIVDKTKLMHLWIAQGFVKELLGKSLEEVAEIYVTELINRKLIQVESREWDGTPSEFSVHDLLYEIIVSKCRDYDILTVHSTSGLILPETLRHLKLYVVPYKTIEPFHLPRLQSLVIEGYTNDLSMLQKSVPKSVKVLDMPCGKLKNISDEIFKLYHITYLRLSYPSFNIERIPKAIEKLRYLEFLDVRYTKVKEVPVEILKLRKLHHLYVPAYAKAPDEIGVLSSLQVLSFVELDNEKCLREVGKLTQLRELGIKIKRENGSQLCSSLAKLTHLRSLSIESASAERCLYLDYPISSSLQFLQLLDLTGELFNVPHWVPSLRGLAQLRLEGSNLRRDLLESIEDLPNLVSLMLRDDAYTGNSLCFKAGKFQKLKRLELQELRGLCRIILEDGTMSNLVSFALCRCELLQELPQRLTVLRKAPKS